MLEDEAEAVVTETTLDTPAGTDPPVVWPKERAAQQGVGLDVAAEPGPSDGRKTALGEWWHSPTLTGTEVPKSSKPCPGDAAFRDGESTAGLKRMRRSGAIPLDWGQQRWIFCVTGLGKQASGMLLLGNRG